MKVTRLLQASDSNWFGRRLWLLLLIPLYPLTTFAAEEVIAENQATGLTKYPNCSYIETQWNDGDSFLVRLTDGTEITVRL